MTSHTPQPPAGDDLVARLREIADRKRIVSLPPDAEDGLRAAIEALTSQQHTEPVAGEVELFALTYLHDWDPPREDGSQPIYPEVSAVYPSWREANDAGSKKADPNKYWVVRAHTSEPLVTKSAYDALAAAKDAEVRSLLMVIENAARMAEQGVLSADGGLAASEIRSLVPLQYRALKDEGGAT